KLRHIIDTQPGKEPKKPDGDEPPHVNPDPYPVKPPKVLVDDLIDPNDPPIPSNLHTFNTAKAVNEERYRDFKDDVEKYKADNTIIEANHRNWLAKMNKFEKWCNESDEGIAIFASMFPKEIGISVRRNQAFKNGPQTFHDFIDGYKRYYNTGVKTGTESTYWESSLQNISIKYSGNNRPRDPATIEQTIDQFDEAGCKGFEVMPRDVFNDEQVHKTIIMKFCNTWGYMQPNIFDFNDFNKKNRAGMTEWDFYYEWIDEVRQIIAVMKHFTNKVNLRSNNNDNGNNFTNQRKPGDPYPDNKRQAAAANEKGKNKKQKKNNNDDHSNDPAGATGPCEYHNIEGHPTNKCNHLKQLKSSEDKSERNEYYKLMKEIRAKRPQASRVNKGSNQAAKAESTSDNQTYDLRQDLSRAIEKFGSSSKDVIVAKNDENQVPSPQWEDNTSVVEVFIGKC
ncbi:hypothetical protein HDU76_010638, partial [Blyttiomyces sp. JEL0837]